MSVDQSVRMVTNWTLMVFVFPVLWVNTGAKECIQVKKIIIFSQEIETRFLEYLIETKLKQKQHINF